jgi:hypothetical protein
MVAISRHNRQNIVSPPLREGVIKMRIWKIAAAVVILLAVPAESRFWEPAATCGLKFEILFSGKAHPGPLTGRVYLMLSRDGGREPRRQVRRAGGIPFWGENVHNLEPGRAGVIDESSFGFPLKSIRLIPPGEYYIQGFINLYTEFRRSDGKTLWLHQDRWEGQNWLRSPGNLFSAVRKVRIDPREERVVRLTCDRVIPPIAVPPDTKYVKRLRITSRLLSDFWGRPMDLGAVVLLPEGYEEDPERFYPVNYVQGHFSLRAPYGFREGNSGGGGAGGRRGSGFSNFWTSEECPRMLAVTFQHPCPYYDDSHVMNSPNLGPYADAVLEELIPYLEENFRIIREPWARVLSGGSTGGWISLALQIFHPDFFGGAFALCPDSVDFRALQLVNIYRDANAYYKEYDWMRVERPDQRRPDGDVVEMMKDENRYELAVGDRCRSGGQWDIYMACFGPAGEGGYPESLWDKKTGDIDRSVALYWKEHFDLRHYLETRWLSLGSRLAGKLHIYVGDMDSYYLNNAVKLMENFLEGTRDPYYAGTVEYGDGKPHCWGPGGVDLIRAIDAHMREYRPERTEKRPW